MDNREQEIGRIKRLIDKLRSITLAVQIAPFAYTSFYIIILFVYPACSENVLSVLDTLFYVSPLVVGWFLVESRILRLCRWHKTACVLPLIPQIFVFVDYHIVRLTKTEFYVHYAMLVGMSILLLISAFNVFLKPKYNGRKETSSRNP